MSWIPYRNGKALDIVEPIAEQVDFVEEAHALAHLNRYNGHGATTCSVARHKLIGLALCPRPLRAHWLLHDVHETRLGEITRPTLDALREIGGTLPLWGEGPDAGSVLHRVILEFKRRHDAAIHEAAGVRLPNEAERKAISEIDHTCLATEHRDFHQISARKWFHEIVGILPSSRRCKWSPPDKTAAELVIAFRIYLPALSGENAPELSAAW